MDKLAAIPDTQSATDEVCEFSPVESAGYCRQLCVGIGLHKEAGACTVINEDTTVRPIVICNPHML